MRKIKKFSEGGRASAMRERRLADIEKDTKRALAKGKSEKEVQAKRAQRIADAEDDYAKRTGADRTKTRAAEQAAEAKLKASRRAMDKSYQPVSVASEKAADTPKIDTNVMAKAPSVSGGSSGQSFSSAFAAARKAGKSTFTWRGKSYNTQVKGDKPATPARSAPQPATSKSYQGPPVRRAKATSKPTAPKTAAYSEDDDSRQERASIAANKAAKAAPKTASEFFGRGLPPPPPARSLAQQQEDWERRKQKPKPKAKPPVNPLLEQLKTYREDGVTKKAKGGKIDGAAVRGKTRAMRKK